jgi:hypothetical protein
MNSIYQHLTSIIDIEKYKNEWLPYWQPNSEVQKCNNNVCNSEFGFFNNKHHCRECGKIYCYKCWGKMAYIGAYHKEVPICDLCYIDHLDQK